MTLYSFSQLILSLQADIWCWDWSLSAKGMQARPLFSKKTVSYVQFLMWIQISSRMGQAWSSLWRGLCGCQRLTLHLTSTLLFRSSLPLLPFFFPKGRNGDYKNSLTQLHYGFNENHSLKYHCNALCIVRAGYLWFFSPFFSTSGRERRGLKSRVAVEDKMKTGVLKSKADPGVVV